MATRTAHGTLTGGAAATTVTLSIAGRRRGLRVQRVDESGALTKSLFWSWATDSASNATAPTASGGDGVYRLTANNPIDVLSDEIAGDNLYVKLYCDDSVSYSVETW